MLKIMKNLNIKILSLSLLFTKVLFFSSCKQSNDAPCNRTYIYQNILASERPAFIYKGNEKLTFIRHPQLDTLILLANGLDSSYSQLNNPVPFDDCSTLIEGQYFKTILKGTINTVKYEIDAYITKKNPDLTSSTMTFVFSIDFVSGAGTSEGFVRSSKDFLNNNLLETDTINNKIYKDILKTPLTSPAMSNFFMLYSQLYGIIKIENYAYGEYLELLKKE